MTKPCVLRHSELDSESSLQVMQEVHSFVVRIDYVRDTKLFKNEITDCFVFKIIDFLYFIGTKRRISNFFETTLLSIFNNCVHLVPKFLI